MREMSFPSKKIDPRNTITNNDVRKELLILNMFMIIGYSLLSIGGLSLILGISLFIVGTFGSFIFAPFGVFLIFGSLFPLGMYGKTYYHSKIILAAMKAYDSKSLFSYLKKDDLSRLKDRASFTLAFYALIEVAPNELFDYLSHNLALLRNNPYIRDNVLDKAINSLALRLGFVDSREMLLEFRKDRKPSKKEAPVESTDIDLHIPVTKVYFVDKLPTDQRSMISGLPIDLKKNVIVACPHCGNMAEKELLVNWLLKNDICPVCKKNLSIDELALVKLST